LSASLERIRRDGVAQSWEEYEVGLAALAVPVTWLDGPGSAAVNVSLPTSRATRAFRSELVSRLRASAARIEASLAAQGH
jgi:DNA-binding IclR family transcriptional regulator